MTRPHRFDPRDRSDEASTRVAYLLTSLPRCQAVNGSTRGRGPDRIDPSQLKENHPVTTITDSTAARRIPPRARQTALAVGAGLITALVMGVATVIAGHGS